MSKAASPKPQKPSKGFPLFPHASGQWAKKVDGKLRYFGSWDDPQGALARYLGTATPAKVARIVKPQKPSKGFPLFPHASGQWAKKVDGQTKYFGSVARDPKGEEALQRYTDKLAGRQTVTGSLKLVDLVNAFLAAKEKRVESGELSPRTLDDYANVCQQVLTALGPQRHVTTLRPADFEGLRAHFSRTHGAVRLCKDITCVRTLFKYAYDSELVDRPIRSGPEFQRPSRVALRKLRNQNGPRMFEAAEIRAMLASAGPQLRAMILLGINAGLGNSDLVNLERRHLDLENGWLNFPRPKTGINRRCPLWPETIEALATVLEKRKTPKDESDIVFVTKRGNHWGSKGEHPRDNPISKEMGKLLRKLGIKRPGLGFYGLRHTFATIGQRTRDKDAVRAIMGHVEQAGDMLAVAYTEEAIGDERLAAVTEYVRRWLRKKV
jgi:integrase